MRKFALRRIVQNHGSIATEGSPKPHLRVTFLIRIEEISSIRLSSMYIVYSIIVITLGIIHNIRPD